MHQPCINHNPGTHQRVPHIPRAPSQHHYQLPCQHTKTMGHRQKYSLPFKPRRQQNQLTTNPWVSNQTWEKIANHTTKVDMNQSKHYTPSPHKLTCITSPPTTNHAFTKECNEKETDHLNTGSAKNTSPKEPTSGEQLTGKQLNLHTYQYHPQLKQQSHVQYKHSNFKGRPPYQTNKECPSAAAARTNDKITYQRGQLN